MEVLRSLPQWRAHVMRAVVDVKINPRMRRKKGPMPQNTRQKRQRVKEEAEHREQFEERQRMAREELNFAPTRELEDAVLQLESGSHLINEKLVGFILQECGHEKALATGIRVHRHISALGYDQDIFLANHLIQMYGKCGRADLAYQVFSRMCHRSTYSWTAMMNVYLAKGHVETVRRVFNLTPKENFVSWNTMIMAYAQFGQMESADHMFGYMVKKTVITWTTMIKAYVNIRQFRKAFWLFKEMDCGGFQVDKVAASKALEACACIGELKEAEVLVSSLAMATDPFLLRGTILGNMVINMYSKCGSLERAVEFFLRMPERDLLPWASLLEAYARGGYIEEAQAMFDEVGEHNLCSWSALMLGYTLSGDPHRALSLVPQMDLDGVGYPDWECWLTIIGACGSSGDCKFARMIQREIVAQELQSRLDIANAVLGMYVKLGEYWTCVRLFAKMKRHSVCSWAAFIAANASIGALRGVRACWCMLQLGVEMDGECAVSLLRGFRGMPGEGIRAFLGLEEAGVDAAYEHLMVMVEVFGSSGEMDAVQELLESMPYEPGIDAWYSFLATFHQTNDHFL